MDQWLSEGPEVGQNWWGLGAQTAFWRTLNLSYNFQKKKTIEPAFNRFLMAERVNHWKKTAAGLMPVPGPNNYDWD